MLPALPLRKIWENYFLGPFLRKSPKSAKKSAGMAETSHTLILQQEAEELKRSSSIHKCDGKLLSSVLVKLRITSSLAQLHKRGGRDPEEQQIHLFITSHAKNTRAVFACRNI